MGCVYVQCACATPACVYVVLAEVDSMVCTLFGALSSIPRHLLVSYVPLAFQHVSPAMALLASDYGVIEIEVMGSYYYLQELYSIVICAHKMMVPG